MENLVRDVEGASNSLFCLHQQALNPDNEYALINKDKEYNFYYNMNIISCCSYASLHTRR